MSKRSDDLAKRSRFRIGDIAVHPDRCMIIKEGTGIHLAELTMSLLVYLAEKYPDPVSRDLLLENVWKNTQLDDNPINKAFTELRKRLGDDATNPRYVKTVRNGGYRLIQRPVFEKDYRSLRKRERSWFNGSPYVGLASFDESHADVFFGRERMREKVLRAMRTQLEDGSRFVLLHGASGSGKTSLLHAGVIPRITQPGSKEDLYALSVARCDLASQSADPLGALAAALATWTLDGRPVFPPQPIEDLKNVLIETPSPIGQIIGEAFRNHADRKVAEHPLAHLLLVIDHGEKLVDATPTDTQANERFSRALTALCDSERTLTTMVVRGDFYQKLQDALPELMELKGSQGHIDVMRPSPREIAEMISGPAECAGLDFEQDPETGDYLDYRLCEDARGKPDVLPLLQHTLRQLYENRDQENNLLTFSAYNEMGRLEGGIAHRAEEVFTSLPLEVQTSLDSVLSALVQVQDTGVVSGKQSSFDTLDSNALNLVKAFIEARLFASSQDDRKNRRFGVTHEALLRQWPRAVEWANENHRLLQAMSHFKIAASRWKDESRSPDHLLNSGRPLIDSTEAIKKFSVDLEEYEHVFFQESMRLFSRKRRIRRSAITALILSTAISIAMAIIAQAASEKAKLRQAETQGHLGYIVGELVEKVDVTENIELLESISIRAIQHYQKQPASEMHTSDLTNYASALNTLGEARRKQGDGIVAAYFFALSTEKSELAIRIDKESSEAWFQLSQSIYYLGLLKFDSGDYEAADKKWRHYLALSVELTKLKPNEIRWAKETSYALNNLGSSSLRKGELDLARKYFELSTKIKQAIYDSSPSNPQYLYDLIDSKSWTYSTLESQGNLIEASRGYDSAIQDLENLLKEHKNANKWKFRLANYYLLSAKIRTKMAEFSEAKKSADEGVRILSKLVELDESNQEWGNGLEKANKIRSDVAVIERLSNLN